MGYYKNAQVCLNGHATTDDTTNTALCSDFCSLCGEKTITTCPSCDAPIRGRYHVPNAFCIVNYHPPAYCQHCGNPFPWTQRKLDAAQELVSDMEELSMEEQEKLNKCFPNIIVDTPMTTVSANRVKRYLAKLPDYAGSCLRDIFVDVMSETAKKIIWPS